MPIPTATCLTGNQIRLLDALGREPAPGSTRARYDEKELRAELRALQLRRAGFSVHGLARPTWPAWSEHDLPFFRLTWVNPGENRITLTKEGGRYPNFGRGITVKFETLFRHFCPVPETPA